MLSTQQENTAKNLYFPINVNLTEEENFLAQVHNGEIKLYSNEEVLAELAEVLGLK